MGRMVSVELVFEDRNEVRVVQMVADVEDGVALPDAVSTVLTLAGNKLLRGPLDDKLDAEGREVAEG